MAHITGHVRIAAPIRRVFDTIVDTRNEPSFNPAMTDVELTPPPNGLGTRFRARMGKASMEMLLELTESAAFETVGFPANDEQTDTDAWRIGLY